jgi:membrane protein required for colicin V production
MPALNWLDIVLAVILLVSVLGGLRKGFSREIIGLAAALLGLLAASQFYRLAGQSLKPYIPQEALSSVAGFLVIFFAVLIAGSIVSTIVRKILKTAGLSTVDRLLGAFYGLVRGSLVAVAVIVGLKTFTTTEAVVQSRMAPYLIEATGLVAKVAPRGLDSRFQREYERLKSPQEIPVQKN